MLFRKKTTPHQDFWAWFQRSNFLSTGGQEVVEKLGKRARAVHECIVFEIGPPDQRPRELIISADGIREAVEHVEALADAAPPMQDWTITRFRPRLPNFATLNLEYGPVTASADTMRFVATPRPPLIDLDLYTHWCDQPDTGPDGPAFIMLDMALGEFDVMCRVGEIAMHPLTTAPENARPWSELPTTIDQLSD